MSTLALALALALGPADLEDRLPSSMAEWSLAPVPPPKEEYDVWIGGHLGVAGAYDGDSPCFTVGFEGRVQMLPWVAGSATIDFQSKQQIDKIPGADFFQIPFMFSALFFPQLDLGDFRPYGLAGFGFTITNVSGSSVKDNTDVNLLAFLGFGVEWEVAHNILLDANVRFVWAQDPRGTGNFSADWAQFTVGILFRLAK